MNVKCARCTKTVYPTEELKCLDKSWHKACFKCDECGMALNMKNYKGYNKTPYCSVHCPSLKPTTVAETPESRRLAENTRLQSQVKYHEDFEKSKGKLTQVADDPETVRIRNTHKIISNVAYHGDLERKQKMEEKRTLVNEMNPSGGTNTTTAAPVSANSHNMYSQVTQQLQAEQLHHQQQQLNHEQAANHTNGNTAKQGIRFHTVHGMQPSRKIGSIVDYDPLNDNYGSIAGTQQQFRVQQGPASHFNPNPAGYYGPGMQPVNAQQLQQQQQMYAQQQQQHQLHMMRQQQMMQQQHQQMQQQQNSSGQSHQVVNPVIQQKLMQQQIQQQHLIQQQQLQQQIAMQKQQQMMKQQQQQQVAMQQQAARPMGNSVGYGSSFRAIYDYAAQDTDEVSFLDGDVLINCISIDEGWMTGTVQRTGQKGMLPANYVEPLHHK